MISSDKLDDNTERTVIDYGYSVSRPKKGLGVHIELLMVVYGIAVFFPWYIVMNTMDLTGRVVFPDMRWSFKWSIASNSGAFVGFLLMAMISNSVSLLTKFMVSWWTIVLSTIAQTIVILVFRGTRHGFVLALLIQFEIDVAVAAACSSFMGFTFLLSRRCTERYYLGYSLSGFVSFLIVLLSANTLKRVDNGVYWSIGVLYSLAVVVVVICIAIFPWLLSLPEIQQLIAEKKVKSVDDEEQKPFLEFIKSRIIAFKFVRLAWSPLLGNIVIGGMAFCIFPGVMFQYKSTDGVQNLFLWILGIYNVGDISGRILASYAKAQMPVVWIVLALRCIFVPFAILSQRVENDFIQGSPFRLSIVFFLGLSTSWLFTHCNIKPTDYAVGAQQIEDCGFFTSLFNQIGFLSGSFLAPLTQIGIKGPIN